MMVVTAFASAWEKFLQVCVSSQGALKATQMVCERVGAAPPVAVHEHFVHLIPV